MDDLVAEASWIARNRGQYLANLGDLKSNLDSWGFISQKKITAKIATVRACSTRAISELSGAHGQI